MLDLQQVNKNAGPLLRYRYIARRIVGRSLGISRLVDECKAADEGAKRIHGARNLLTMDIDNYVPDLDIKYWHKMEKNRALPHVIRRTEFSLKLIALCDTKKLVNFGGSYPLLELLAMERFPDMEIWSLNRHEEVTAINRANFDDRIHFVTSGEFMEVVRSKPDFLRGATIHHSYAMIFMTERFMYEFYKALYEAGVEYLTCVEFTGLSRETLTYFEHSHDYRPSAHYFDHYSMHNYPHMMRGGGYELIHAEARQRETSPEWQEVGFSAQRMPHAP